jgi:hypothetical protein
VAIPPFRADGNLPEGIHKATWEELRERLGWNEERRTMLAGLRTAMLMLADGGCSRLYVDGSFATSKEFPGDWDACWDPANVVVDQLNELVLDNSPGGIYRQKQFLLGELHPSSARATADHTFLEFFQVSKQDGRTKGIVLLDPREAIR